MDRNRTTVADIRAKKAAGRKISMLYVTTLDEAAAADEAGIDMLSIEGKYFSPEMRKAAGRCFVQVGLPYGGWGKFDGRHLATAEDYLQAAYHFTSMGGDCFYCAASFDVQKVLCDNHIPIVAHVGLIPSYITWTGFRAVGKTAVEAASVWQQVQKLESIGCFGAELEVVPDRVGAWISANTSMIMLGMGAGPGADAQYLFSEDVLGHTAGHKPRHAKTYRNFAAEFERLQKERVAAFKEFIGDVNSGAYPAPEHSVAIADAEYDAFLKTVRS
ncbi:3-methyl-2-oxobutanoate hydroxymethyltransferase [Roseibium aggregatum]|uniref:3-methyl-2-oxobutanoate hydroxymethyltransferase n=1 Tax=Roseibium aggregatum TaxID=187304 RepID=UPI001A8D8C26|nr:3-methyl-2-oxobutanoate hydroxymethyltransferase [Roseibium aggregatum]MBN8181216.1 3-methyl-2-oxobutanoate hydroxymethyltransferase [Roseibium aggregatum]UES44789.1 3-methyl-2-oxobutanoate hydroxymethyltransferase [Roseibium aggregatum]